MADPNTDPYAYLGFSLNPDGSMSRLLRQPPGTPASSEPTNPFHLSKDITINESKGTWARIFVPREALDSSPTKKLPLFVYFHGGGFVICKVNTSAFDTLYNILAAETPAVVVSVGYRLAPEHRLPAAYDDCEEGLNFLKSCKDEWLTNYADFSNCFLMGTSAGGNITYQVGLRAAANADDLTPIQIRGLILHHAYFGGTKRTDSEMRLMNDKVIPPSLSDLMWGLCLPIGSDRDHEYCNPMAGIKPGHFDRIKALGWKILAMGWKGDPGVDRQIELAKKLEENGISVVEKFEEGGSHGCDLLHSSFSTILSSNLKEFVASAVSS